MPLDRGQILSGYAALTSKDHLPICEACGTLYDLEPGQSPPSHCPICDDPRQFVPSSGQSFTTLPVIRDQHRNVFQQDSRDSRIWHIFTEPKFGIGQRAILLDTPSGIVIWDCLALIDDETVRKINSIGTKTVLAIVISHPHFYTTHALWSALLHCPVYVASEDTRWLFSQCGAPARRILLHDRCTSIAPGVTAIKAGGHFPGSLLLHWATNPPVLLHSDTLMSVPSSRNPDPYRSEKSAIRASSSSDPRQLVTHSFAFMWSIPNMLPLDPATISQILRSMRGIEFEATYGNIMGLDVSHKEVKQRILDSAKNQIVAMGWAGRPEGDQVLNMEW